MIMLLPCLCLCPPQLDSLHHHHQHLDFFVTARAAFYGTRWQGRQSLGLADSDSLRRLEPGDTTWQGLGLTDDGTQWQMMAMLGVYSTRGYGLSVSAGKAQI